MAELKEIVDAAARARRCAPGEQLLLGTVVRVWGAAPNRLAARMLVGGDHWLAGSVSGGCVEADLIRRAWWATRHGGAALMSCDATGNGALGEAEKGGGSGTVDLLLQRSRPNEPADPLAFLSRCLEAERTAAQVMVFASQRADVAVGHRVWIEPDGAMASAGPDGVVGSGSGSVADAMLEQRARSALRDGITRTFDIAGVSALVEAILPPPHLYVFGCVPDALPLVNLSSSLGWKITVCDESVRGTGARRFVAADRVLLGPAAALARTLGDDGRAAYAVVMPDRFERDAAILNALLESRVRYIGVLGPRGPTERLLGRKVRDTRLHAPAGLDLGPAETPAEVALAIVAQIQTVRAGGAGARMNLPDRAGMIDSDAGAGPPREAVRLEGAAATARESVEIAFP
jgi:xanthine dehydrogenase accessory factor